MQGDFWETLGRKYDRGRISRTRSLHTPILFPDHLSSLIISGTPHARKARRSCTRSSLSWNRRQPCTWVAGAVRRRGRRHRAISSHGEASRSPLVSPSARWILPSPVRDSCISPVLPESAESSEPWPSAHPPDQADLQPTQCSTQLPLPV